MRTPLILISMGRDGARIGAPLAYGHSVTDAGGTAIYAYQVDTAGATALAASCDGLLMTGGGDADPHLYGQPLHPLTDSVDPVRDRTELDLFAAFSAARKPILGICRGLQLINIALGGTLTQHIPETLPFGAPSHADSQITHDVQVVQPCFLTRALRVPSGARLQVNSTHHQCARALGGGLRIVARADDETVEAVEGDNVWAVQWHPERMGEHMAPLFNAWIELARNRVLI